MTTTEIVQTPLYALADLRVKLDALLFESEGEATPEVETIMAQVEGKFEKKIEQVALYIREQEHLAEIAQAEAIRLAALGKTRQSAVERLKQYLLDNMVKTETTKIAGELVTVATQLNNPKVVGDLDERTLGDIYTFGDDVERTFVRVIPAKYELDRKAVLAARKANPEAKIPEGLAVVRETGLRIR